MAINKIIDNPFVLGYNIPDEYFCDRLKETKKIIELLQNKNNVVLVSERRIGKSSLLTHVLKDKNFTRNFSAFYVDIYKTENAEQFAKALTDAMIKGGIKFPKTISRSLLEFLSKFSFEYGLDIFDKPSIGMHVKPHMTKVTCFLMPQRTRCALMVPLEADRTALPTYGRDSTSAGLRRQRGIQTN